MSPQYETTFLKFSPDGQYVFDNGGSVFDANLQPVTFLGYELNDITFNPDSKNFYVNKKGEKTISVYTYDYNNPLVYRTSKSYAYRQTSGTVAQLFYQANNAIVVSTTDSGNFQIEVIPVPTSSEATPNYLDKPYMPIYFTPNDLVFDQC